jgi:hypothetical protein
MAVFAPIVHRFILAPEGQILAATRRHMAQANHANPIGLSEYPENRWNLPRKTNRPLASPAADV